MIACAAFGMDSREKAEEPYRLRLIDQITDDRPVRTAAMASSICESDMSIGHLRTG